MITFAHGPCREATGIPGSAFSKGDLLMLTSASSLSRCPDLIAAAAGIIGVAMADSLESLDNQVPYVVAQRDSVFWASTTTSSGFTPGQPVDLIFSAASRFYASDSANTAVARVDMGGGSSQVLDNTAEPYRVRIVFDPGATLFTAT